MRRKRTIVAVLLIGACAALPAAGSAVSTPAAHEPPAKARAVDFENPETVKEAWQEIARPELLSERRETV
jgi:hypothetical protein